MDQTHASPETTTGNLLQPISPGSQPDTPRPSLTADVLRFIQQIKTNHPDRYRLRPKALKTRIITLIEQMLPPHKSKGGRPREKRITRAVEMVRAQGKHVLKGDQSRINWNRIALQCIPDFVKIRSEHHRRTALAKLRNSVYARLKRKRTHKPKASLSDSNTATTC